MMVSISSLLETPKCELKNCLYSDNYSVIVLSTGTCEIKPIAVAKQIDLFDLSDHGSVPGALSFQVVRTYVPFS